MVTDPFIVSGGVPDEVRAEARAEPPPACQHHPGCIPWLAAAVQATHDILADEFVITVKRDASMAPVFSAVLPRFEAELSICSHITRLQCF
jgi:hypothetical protein